MSEHQRRLRIKPRLIQGSLFVFLATLTSVMVWLVGFTSADDEHGGRPQTYTVLVGAEDVSAGASVAAFFPGTLAIHAGDTVHWQRNTHERHTVTFLAGTPLPAWLVPAPDGLPSPLMRNPLVAFPVAPADGRYDGSDFANSGALGPDGEEQYDFDAFDLTFTTPGTYNYVCVVHGVRMSLWPGSDWSAGEWQHSPFNCSAADRPRCCRSAAEGDSMDRDLQVKLAV
jgi:plastocyanin